MIKLTDAMTLLKDMEDNSVDLILTDPPYIISKPSGMQKYIDETGDKSVKAVRTDFGDWDRDFTMEELSEIITEYYRVLRKGGTAIIFFDVWKVTPLAETLTKNKFKQLRFIEWIKTNPVPVNQSVNYLSNARDMALVAVKGGKPTFNSKYDVGIYKYPIYQDPIYKRFHPTQKSLLLMKDLIEKHSNPGDLVVDTFAGSGTTAIAASQTGRNFLGCEKDLDYYNQSLSRIDAYKQSNLL